MTLHKALSILFENGIHVEFTEKTEFIIENEKLKIPDIVELANCLESPGVEMISRFTELCKTCGNLKNATRLWNFADNQSDPEFFWFLLSDICPWAFSDPKNFNSLHFTY